MCTTCGCSANDAPEPRQHDYDEAGRRISVESDILARNQRLATANRARLAAHGIFAVNLLSSPGAGKTTLLERTLRDLAGTWRCAVIEGDQQTDRDAQRIAASGVPVVQVNTGTGCHLDAQQVGHALEHFDLGALDLLFIENVGNLVCPAAFDLGEQHKVVILSVTEGEDKPLKYPQMFRAASLLLLSKLDLLPHLQFDVAACRAMARQVQPALPVCQLSTSSGLGLAAWYDWLAAGVAQARHARP